MTAFKRVAHSLDDLLGEVNARWPRRPKASDGSLGDPAHAARVSDHNPDANGVVRARDFTEWDVGTPAGSDDVAEVVAETIRIRRDPRVKYVIWSGRIFASYATAKRKAWEWGPYTGPNGHFSHVHVSVLPGSQGDAEGPWGVHGEVPGPTARKRILKRGNSGQDVLLYQTLLNQIHDRWPNRVPRLNADGDYGAKTEAAVLAFERLHNAFIAAFDPKKPRLHQDGVATIPTQDAIVWWAEQARKG